MSDFKLICIIAGVNITLSALHWLLDKIKDKTKTNLDNNLGKVVDYLITVLNFVTANRPHTWDEKD